MRATVISVGLNIHDKPNGKIIDALVMGERVLVCGQEEMTAHVRWLPVQYVGKGNEKIFGFADARYLTLDPEPITATPPQIRRPIPDWEPPPQELPSEHYMIPTWVPVVVLAVCMIIAAIIVMAS
jgi:hypothetical protein